eukprot:COSAG02_NODE_2712_length_8183_cov_20.357867_3_plen_259_part_00
MLQNWPPPSRKASGRPVWVLRLVLLRSHTTGVLVFVMLQKEKIKKNKTGQAKVATQRPVRAAAVAAVKNVRHDGLHEYERRVDIVASMLVLNIEAQGLDDSTPRLMPEMAMLYGGLGGMEGNEKEKTTDKIRKEKLKLISAMESACLVVPGATDSAASGTAASGSAASGQSPASTPALVRMLAKLQSCRAKAKTKGQVVARRDKKNGDTLLSQRSLIAHLDYLSGRHFLVSCCCCCLSLRSGSITAARITSRRSVPGF